MSFSTLTVDLVFYGVHDSVTMSPMKIGERSFKILYISIANVLIIFERKCLLVTKGAYIRGTYIWEAYIRDFTQSAFVNTNDIFTFNHFFAQERSMFIEMEFKYAICVFLSLSFVQSHSTS